jgi:hypothetical protein
VAYLIGKLIHLVSLIFWIGPPLGAYFMLIGAHRSNDKARIVWAERCTERVLAIEHVAFIVLLASGAYLVWLSDGAMLAMPWLQKKLWAVGGVVAFETFDIWISHRVWARVLADADPTSSVAWRRAMRLRSRLFVAAIPVALVLLPAIFYFAVAKQ